MSMVTSSEATPNRRVVPDSVCTACGCLCDDIEIEIDGARIVEARNACPPGRSHFVADLPSDGPACLLDGQPATFEQGIERAARLLAEARSPLIFGLVDATTDAQRAAISLGDRIGAVIDVPGASGAGAMLDALETVGAVTCTLGEIKNRADLIVVWRADPVASHPRLFSRYALDPPGLFVPAGRPDRYCVILDVRETESVREAADQFIALDGGRELEAIWTLRALVKGIDLDPREVESSTGLPLATWQGLADRMKSARYGVLSYGGDGAETSAGPLIAQGLHSLARDLNASTRFVCLALSPGGGNAVGARNAMAWSTGYPAAVSLARGYPQYGPGELTPDALLRRKEVDAVMIVSGDPVSALSEEAREHLSGIPSIALQSDPAAARDFRPTLIFRTAVFGIQAPGTVYRTDGVPLPIRELLPASCATDHEILKAIERRVRSLVGVGPTPNGSV